MADTLTIDDSPPLPIRRPTTVAEVGELVREAKSAGQGLFPVGGATRLGLGLPPTKPGFALETRALDQVIDYPARDMTVTVRGGITVADLQQLLGKEGQRLPVEVPNPGRSTVGGAIAVNASGPRRHGNGTLRDYLIGISFVTDEGVEVKAGGRVVKNVAGYDLMKLQIGALGTLGIVTQVTLKVFPRPEDQAVLAFGLNAAAVGPTLDRLHASASRPVALELLNSAAARAVSATAGVKLPEFDEWVLVVGFEQKSTTVAWQVSTLKDEMKSAPVRDLTEWRGPSCDPIWDALVALQNGADSRFGVKANVLPSRVATVAAETAAAFPGGCVFAHAGNGIVSGFAAAGEEFSAEKAAGIVARLTTASDTANGNVVVSACPPAWKKSLPIWGQPRGDRDLMRTIKATLDPQNLFNPGRMFAEL